MKKKISMLLLISILLSILLFNLLNEDVNSNKDNFEINDEIDLFVISLRHEDRMKNIEIQQKKIGKTIQIFDAVKGDHLNEEKLIQENILSKNAILQTNEKRRKREIGCYLSHLNLLKQIQNNSEDGYTIIFEDDIHIKTDNFLKDVKQIIENVKGNFDLIYLGNINNNNGKQFIDNIYYVDVNGSILGTHGYLINNNSINKLIPLINFIEMPIDIVYEKLSKENKINTFIIFPTLVNQGGAKSSTINDLSIENFTTYTCYK